MYKPVQENKPVSGCQAPAQDLLISLEKCWLTQAWAEATRLQVFIGWQVMTHQEENSKEGKFRKTAAVAPDVHTGGTGKPQKELEESLTVALLMFCFRTTKP